MKEIEFVLHLRGDALKVMLGLFEIPISIHKDNKGAIALMLVQKCDLVPSTSRSSIITSRVFFEIGDIDIQNIDTKE